VVDDCDTDLIPIKLKPKKTEEVPEPTKEVKKEEESFQPTGATPIKWTSRGWKRPEDEPDGTPNSTTPKMRRWRQSLSLYQNLLPLSSNLR
jgi:hypothetical protein